MWGRIIEAALGCWLVITALFAAPGEHAGLLRTACGAAGVLAAILAIVSYAEKFGRAHLLSVPLSAVLFGTCYLSGLPLESFLRQNGIFTSLLLLIFAVVPSRCAEPPPEWREMLRSGETPHTAAQP